MAARGRPALLLPLLLPPRPSKLLARETHYEGPAIQPPDQALEGQVLIGVCTGGPRALECLLPTRPADFPWPVLVAQRMPVSFTGLFATRLDRLCGLDVLDVLEVRRP